MELMGKRVVKVGFEQLGAGEVSGFTGDDVIVQFSESGNTLELVKLDDLINLEDSEAVFDYLEEQMDLPQEEIEAARLHFNYDNITDFAIQYINGNITTKSSYSDLLYWMYEDYDKYALLDKIVSGEVFAIDDDQYIEVDSGVCVFHYM